MAALGREGYGIFNVGTARETSVTELYEVLRRAVGVPTEPLFGPAKPGEQRRASLPTRNPTPRVTPPGAETYAWMCGDDPAAVGWDDAGRRPAARAAHIDRSPRQR